MKVIKAPRFSLFFKPFLQGSNVELIATMYNFIHFDKPEEPLLEEEAWPIISEELGGVSIDNGDFKPKAEWLAHGFACSPKGHPVSSLEVSISVEEVKKTLAITGEREWLAISGGPVATSDPIPFEVMPISNTKAFGGLKFADNPVGIGFWQKGIQADKYPLPCITYPGTEMDEPQDVITPAYFSPIDQMSSDRQQYAGTYDEVWMETGYPGFPQDFNLLFNQTAQNDQRWEGYFNGRETFHIENMHPDHPFQRLTLPGIRGRIFLTIERENSEQSFEEIPLVTDTVSLLPHRKLAVLLQRGRMKVESLDFKEVVSIMGAFEWQKDPRRSLEYYSKCRDERTNWETKADALLKVSELYPEKWKEPSPKLFDVIKPRNAMSTSDGTPKLDALWGQLKKQLDEGLKAAGSLPYDELIQSEAYSDMLDQEEPGIKEMRAQIEKITSKTPETFEELAETRKELDKLETLAIAYGEDERQTAEAWSRKQAKFFGYDYDELIANAEKNFDSKSSLTTEQFVNAELSRIIDDQKNPEEIREAAKRALPVIGAIDFDKFDSESKELQTRLMAVAGHELPEAPILSPAASMDLREELQDINPEKDMPVGKDLRGADLSMLDLRKIDLSKADLTSANLKGAILDEAKLDGACLAHADLTKASLQNASAIGANFGKAKLDGTTFASSNLEEANFSEASGASTVFSLANLEAAIFSKSNFVSPDFVGAKLVGITFFESVFKGALLNGTYLEDLLYFRCELNESNFMHARGSGITFVGGSLLASNFKLSSITNLCLVEKPCLDRCDFKLSVMEGNNFRGASLEMADFGGANLTATDFSETNLKNSNFKRAFARQAGFHRAKLYHADLSGADFMQANFMLSEIDDCLAEETNFFGAVFIHTKIRNTDLKGANLENTSLKGVKS